MSATAIEATRVAESRLRAWALALESALARVIDAAIGGAVFAVTLGVYNATLAPGLTYVSLDGNEIATVPHQLGLLHSPGYPFYTWAGKLFTYLPFGDVAHRMNLMSAAGAAGAAALLYGTVVILTRSRIAAVFSALLFAFSPTLWSQAVITEVYSPNIFMVALTLFLLFSWGERARRRALSGGGPTGAVFLWGTLLVFGLSLGTHLSNLALAPPLALYVWLTVRAAHIPRGTVLLGLCLLLLALSQFAWLPLRASTLNDELMIRYTPDDPRSVFDYVFNVFHEDRFAFPLSGVPDRLGVYADAAGENFGLWGMLLAGAGIWDMFRRQKKAFYLLAIAYLAEIAYFTQYNVTDVAVFFIPAHLLLVIFIAFGVRRVASTMTLLASRFPLKQAALGSLALVLVFPVTYQMQENWASNDHSGDSTVRDFYAQVFQRLPANSVLAGRPGVPGFDLFHYYLVERPRPDVVVPQIEAPDALTPEVVAGRPVFTTVTPDGRGAGDSLAEGELFPEGLWYVPVLAAPSTYVSWLGGHPLTLYETRSEPPAAVVESAQPQHLVEREMDGVELVGFDLDQAEVKAGQTLHIRLYWRPLKPPVLNFYQVATILGDDSYREIHSLGFQIVSQYQRMGLAVPEGMIVEDYDLVVMSSLPEGKHTLSVATCDFGSLGSKREQRVDLAEITVVR